MIREEKIPFEIPNVNHGMVRVKGLLHIKKEKLVLEFDKKDGFVGIIKSGVQEAEIPYGELESISYNKKFFRGEIILDGKSMKTFKDVPGAEQGTCRLKISRKHRKDAEQAVRSARVVLSEFKLKEMDE